MSDGGSIGKAYVQIVPTTKGIAGALSDELGGAGEEAGKKTGLNIGGMIKSAIAAAGIGTAVKSAISEGAKLQQSIGGIETLFGAGGAKSVQEYADAVGQSVEEVQDKYDALKTSEATMLQYANDAWKTAGLSANDYMETSTSFAASLLSSLDGDTQAAADAANNAVIAMSDNANKMGTDMASIQNAYMGFAKGNYTMLDNLKLGYGGTKTEMERLLADAEKISGVEYDIDNLADVYNAVSVIQDQLGITGTTAKEASSTFSGSFASMQAAAQNVLGALTTGGDVGAALSSLGESAKTFITGNVIPMLQNLIAALPELLREGVGIAGEIVSELLRSLPEMITALLDIIPALADGFTAALPGLLAALTEVLPAVLNGVMTQLPTLIDTLIGFITANLPTILTAGMEILLALVNGVLEALPQLAAAAPRIVETVVEFVVSNLPTIIEAGVQLMIALTQGVLGQLPTLLPMVFQIVMTVLNTLIGYLPQIIQGGVQILASLVKGVLSNLGTVLRAGQQIFSTLWGILKTIPSKVISVGADIVKGIWSGISNSFKWIKDKISGWVGNVVDFIKGLFKIGSPSKLMADEVGAMLPAGMAEGVEARTDLVRSALRDLTDETVGDAVLDATVTRSMTAASAAVPAGENGQLGQIVALLTRFISLYMENNDGRQPSPDALVAYIDAALGRVGAKKARGVL